MAQTRLFRLFVIAFSALFVMNTYASQTVRIMMKDEGATEQNITKPRIIIQNTDREAIKCQKLSILF